MNLILLAPNTVDVALSVRPERVQEGVVVLRTGGHNLGKVKPLRHLEDLGVELPRAPRLLHVHVGGEELKVGLCSHLRGLSLVVEDDDGEGIVPRGQVADHYVEGELLQGERKGISAAKVEHAAVSLRYAAPSYLNVRVLCERVARRGMYEGDAHVAGINRLRILMQKSSTDALAVNEVGGLDVLELIEPRPFLPCRVHLICSGEWRRHKHETEKERARGPEPCHGR
mmetsp:Transcript_38480/g.121222  ORF Transcript_38480/g.121222 Transcript_38480/m.121222 type:complete len:227 (+) Transcript_38480:2306-2986(+)